jgi:hypothetical protein
MHKLNMKHEKHPFIRDSNPVPLGQKSGALTTELPGHLPVYTSIEDFEYCNTSIEVLQYFGHPNPKKHLMALLVTILGSKNKKKYSEF